MKLKKLYVISNDKVFKNNSSYFVYHNDLVSILSCFINFFNVHLVCRFTKKKNKFLIDKKIKIISFFFFKNWISLRKDINKVNFLFISITPFNFIVYFFIKLLGQKKIYFYLRSNGFLEYKKIYGNYGKIFYSFMYYFISLKALFIVTSKELLNYNSFGKKNVKIVRPSELNDIWLSNRKSANLKKVQLLYVGRIRVEKGIFNLLELMKNTPDNYYLNVVGLENFNDFNLSNKIKYYKQEDKLNNLINFYDNSNIFILPSYTESAPKVIWESLARLRPVIVFREIKHVAHGKFGVYVCDREVNDLIKTINFIMNNYKLIQNKIKNNNFPLKKDFKLQFCKFIN
jgi:glycosyltransferase involved in cell wall biosynthesis